MRWYDSIMENLRIQSAEKTEDLIHDMTIEKLAKMMTTEGKLDIPMDFDFGAIFKECDIDDVAAWLKKEMPYTVRFATKEG